MPGARRVRRGRRRRVAGRRADRRPWRRASTAFEIAIVIPRSLNDPVGFAPSTFRQHARDAGSLATSRGASSSGVLPSSSVTTGVASVTGRCSRYASMSPGQRRHAPRRHSSSPTTRSTEPTRCDRVDVAQRVDRRAQVGLARPVGDEDRAGRRRRCPVCCIDWIDTPCSPNSPAIAASTPGRSATSSEQVELRLDLVDRRGSACGASVPIVAPLRPSTQVLGRVDEVAEHRATRSGRRRRRGRRASARRPRRPR